MIAEKITENNTDRFKSIWENKKILIADDDDICLILINEILKKTNAKIINAYNGEHAIDLYKKNKDISLVLLDYKMPLMKGDAATKKIKKLENNIPVIILTANYDNCVKEKCIKAGCDDIIHKPLHKMDLLLIVEKWMNRKVENYDLKFEFGN